MDERNCYPSDLFALANNLKPGGEIECHWCGAAAPRKWKHGDAPITPFVKTKSTAKRLGSGYMCAGCWAYRWPRFTVKFLDGSFKDGQTGERHSWWMTTQGAWAIRPEDRPLLYEKLLRPPSTFCLSLLDCSNCTNLIQLSVCNSMTAVKIDDPLRFTINNIEHTYTVYELTEAVKSGDPTGTEPGVQALMKLLGPCPVKFPEPEKKGRGRPKEEDMIDGRITKAMVK